MKTLRVKKLFMNFDHLGTRESGRELRKALESQINNKREPGRLKVDFQGINTITQSFCDEAFGVLIRENGFDFFRKRFSFTNTSNEVESIVRFVVKYSEFERNEQKRVAEVV